MALAESICTHREASGDNEEVWRIEYRGMQCSFEYGGGICEILDTGLTGGTDNGISTKRLTDAEALSRLMVGAVIIFGICSKQFTLVDCILLPALTFPLRIYGTTRRDEDQELYITDYQCVPCMKSNGLDCSTYQEGDLILEIDNRRYPLRLRDRLGYYPAKTEVTIDIDAYEHILIRLSDKEFHKEVTIAYFDLE